MPLPPAAAIEALLLDLDDTILDDSAGSRPAWEAAVALLHEADPALRGAPLLDAIRAQADWFWSDPGRHRRGRLDLYAARLEILERALGRIGKREPELTRRAVDRYFEERERSYRLAPGAAEALSRLREAVPRLALVTNGASEPQRAKVERFGLAGFFDHVQVEGEFGVGKPEPAAFLNVASVLAVPVEGCLMVGDDHGRDVLGALAAGMHAAWLDVAGRGAPPEPPPRPHAIVRSLAQLADLLVAASGR